MDAVTIDRADVDRPRARGTLGTVVAVACGAALFGLAHARAASAQSPVYPGASWERVRSPEEVGWSSAGLAKAREYSESLGSAAVMVVHRGRVVAEWGETSRKFPVHSIRKSLLSSLYGIFVERGRIDLDATLAELGIDDKEPLSPVEKQARVRDLISARSGVYRPALAESIAMAAGRPQRGSHAPGTFWYYNNWDFNVAGVIFEQETGEKIHAAFKQHIGDAIGMEDFQVEDGSYSRGDGTMPPAYPFRMTARDMARYGLLYLRKGRWEGVQVVPEKWVEESTVARERYGYHGGYGYMWWASVDGDLFPNVNLGKGAFAAWGAGHEPLSNHIIAVIPEHDLVFVHRMNSDEDGPWVSSAQIGWILKLILDAKK